MDDRHSVSSDVEGPADRIDPRRRPRWQRLPRDTGSWAARLEDVGDHHDIDPCSAAIPQRPLCAGSGLAGAARHRVGATRDRYAVHAADRRWLFCSRRCLTRWCGELAGAAS
jgi:hypothetical protein